MTFDRTHLLVVWGGSLPGGEIWSNSLRMANSHTGQNPVGIYTTDALHNWLYGEIQSEVKAWHVNPAARINFNATLEYVKANYVGMNGRYYDEANTHEYLYNPVIAGGAGGAPPPNQVTLAVSLVTGRSRGYAHRGRFYMPLPMFQLANDGLAPQNQIQDLATAAAGFITALNDNPGLDIPDTAHHVMVMSSRGVGATHPVTGVEVGRVLDTQRRRRTELAELYAEAPVNL